MRGLTLMRDGSKANEGVQPSHLRFRGVEIAESRLRSHHPSSFWNRAQEQMPRVQHGLRTVYGAKADGCCSRRGAHRLRQLQLQAMCRRTASVFNGPTRPAQFVRWEPRTATLPGSAAIAVRARSSSQVPLRCSLCHCDTTLGHLPHPRRSFEIGTFWLLSEL